MRVLILRRFADVELRFQGWQLPHAMQTALPALHTMAQTATLAAVHEYSRNEFDCFDPDWRTG